MKGFKHLQLISIKNPIFNNSKKSNACRFLNSYALKWYEVRCLKKLFRGSNFVQKSGPSYKNGVNTGVNDIMLAFSYRILPTRSYTVRRTVSDGHLNFTDVLGIYLYEPYSCVSPIAQFVSTVPYFLHCAS